MYDKSKKRYVPEGKPRTTMGPACDTYNMVLRTKGVGTNVRLRNTFTGAVLLKGKVPPRKKLITTLKG